MTIEEVIKILNASRPSPFTSLQEYVLRCSWEGKTYTLMATEAFYGAEHLRKIGSELWIILSDFWGETITKSNFRKTLESRCLTRAQQKLIDNTISWQFLSSSLEFPSGPVALDSKFYIPRPPIEELAYAEISEPGSVIRIKGSRKMGKSSLVLRILDRAATLGYQVVSLDFQQADQAVFSSLDRFLRWFCANVSLELQKPSQIDHYWDEEIGSKVSCTVYFQAYLLAQLEQPLVLTLNEVNQVFEYPEVASEFLPLLRYWHEQSKLSEIWQKFRLVFSYSTENYVPLKITQSPFNIGLPLHLLPFNVEQIQTLAQRHGLNWISGQEANQLLNVVGGHPHLVRLAFYHLCQEDFSLEALLQQAITKAGIYHAHLQELQEQLQDDPLLQAAFMQVLESSESVLLSPLVAYKLYSLGLINLEGNEATISCELYRVYFSKTLSRQTLTLKSSIQQLEEQNLALQKLVNLDSLTGLANRRYFETCLLQEWQKSARTGDVLSIILCNIDFFKAYNEAYGFAAGDQCLQKIAGEICECVQHPADLIARYSGDEFVILLPHTEMTQAVTIAETIKKQVKALKIAHDPERMIGMLPMITLSIGVASTIPALQTNVHCLMQAVLNALYQSKTRGRDLVSPSFL